MWRTRETLRFQGSQIEPEITQFGAVHHPVLCNDEHHGEPACRPSRKGRIPTVTLSSAFSVSLLMPIAASCPGDVDSISQRSDFPIPLTFPSGGLIGRTAPGQVHGHNDQPALHLREGVRRVFRNHDVIALGDSPWRSAFEL